ncbi:BAZ1A [Bugula neritina]|uniref:Bromodomain adjacent to zinc finger domain protein 1A n=1 Tax=Bugula neritina TaxID=10212 RepID=A0A7J7K8W3_BUGNE|nr:BAZ1A [Bugula neritina]
MDELVSALNTRGHRESTLKVKVLSRRRRLQQLSEQQPEFVLGEHSMHEMDQPVAATHQNIKSRSRIAKGLIQNTSAQESLELNLREMLLDLEERVFVGALGSLKSQGGQQGSVERSPGEWRILSPGQDDGDSLVVRDLLRALLQIQRAIEPKFLCKPLGSAETDKKKPGPKKSKKEEVAEAKDEGAEEGPQTCILDRWTDSLLNATSLSQIFLHMCTLESSIVWSKSALNARCRLCRRKGDGEKMLLCDMCDRGHHMYCLKPPVKDVPRGDWYCPECRPKQVRSRKASRRKSFYEEEESNEGEDEETQADDSVYDEETASSSEEEPKHPKIKLLRAGGSGRSSPVSLCSAKDSKSRRSRTNTPEVDSSRFRRSAAPSPEVVPAKKSKTSNRHSEGSRRQSKGSRAASPSEGSNRSSVGSARANLSEEVAQLAQCEEIVRVMVEMDDCWPFLAPVSKREVPDYYAIIKQPMDCQTILSKYKTVKYTHVSQMIADVRQMFTNCSVYNVSSSSIYKMGERLSRFFEKQLKALRLEGNSSKRSRRT